MTRKKKVKTKRIRSIIDLEQKLPEVKNRTPYTKPAAYLKPDGKGDYIEVSERRPSKTLLVNQIRKDIDSWRDRSYESTRELSQTSRRLMEWWFTESHFDKARSKFQFYFAQKEAIESIIYLYEINRMKDAADLIFEYMDPNAYEDDLFTTKKQIEESTRERRILRRIVPETGLVANQEIPRHDHYRYAVKMATGTGKTLVMAMAIVWSYFHKKFEEESTLSKSFLVIAPNVIVFERLKEDFENGVIFKEWDLIPPEWKHDWQMTYILRGESRKTTTDGTLYLTNIHQLYETRESIIIDPVTRLLGKKPKDNIATWEESMIERVKTHNNLMVINDEAHHVHDEDLEWMQVILRLHDNLKDKTGKGLSIQLDFSATPRDPNGTFFPWIICDYPLAQAIEDRIVKAPLIVHQSDKIEPDRYDKASVAYAEWINIAISRWKEHNDAYQKIGAKPVLFIMAEKKKDADDIYKFLKTKAEFSGEGQLLLIHTDTKGEITKKDLDKAREAARAIDLPNNKIRAIVSVLMLREGWDVRNVSIVLGLRPFSSKANILPEQSVGRGLRLIKNIGPEYIQILEIIGTNNFENFVKKLEVEGVGVGYTKQIPSLGELVFPHKAKLEFDIELPVLTPTYSRDFIGIDESIIYDLPANPRDLKDIPGKTSKVELIETLTQKTVGQKQIKMDVGIPEINKIITNLTNRICSEARIQGNFSLVYPIVKKYLSSRFFGKEVDLDDNKIRRLLSDVRNSNEIVQTLSKIIGEKSVKKIEVSLRNDPIILSELDGFYWKREWTECDKTIFNITPCFNDFEKHVAQFLDQAKDIERFVKLAETYTKFSIEYINHKGAIAFYYPDYIAFQRIDNNDINWIIETKGWEHEDVPLKDYRTVSWCEKATQLTGSEWKYLKISYSDYMKVSSNLSYFHYDTIDDLINGLTEKQVKIDV